MYVSTTYYVIDPTSSTEQLDYATSCTLKRFFWQVPFSRSEVGDDDGGRVEMMALWTVFVMVMPLDSWVAIATGKTDNISHRLSWIALL